MTKNYIGQCITPNVEARVISKVTVPAGGLKAGQVVIAETLDNTIAGNYEVYKADKPSTANLGSDFVALVVNDGFFTCGDLRIEGQPNYYKNTFKDGETAPVIFLDRHLTFNIGADSITGGTANVGQFLYPVDGSNDLTVGDSIPEGTSKALKVVAIYNTPVGGNFGAGFATSYICVAQ